MSDTYALQWTDGEQLKNHGLFKSVDQAIESIFLWWNLNDFEPLYIRQWKKDDVTNIDYGSHTQFYLITKIDRDNFGDVMFLGAEKYIDVPNKSTNIVDQLEEIISKMENDEKYKDNFMKDYERYAKDYSGI